MNVVIENLIKSYHKDFQLAIDDLAVESGEIVGLVGNNGAGKTTLLKCILDLIKLDSGRIFIGSYRHNKTDKWLKSTGAYLDKSFLFDFMTPTEYFDRLRKNFEISKESLYTLLDLHKSFLSSVNFKKYIRNLSDGNIQKIGIISSLIHCPELLILDEPFNYLDPSSQFQLVKILNEYHRKRKGTIIVSSHNLEHLDKLANRIILLESGKILLNEHNVDNTKIKIQDYFINSSLT